MEVWGVFYLWFELERVLESVKNNKWRFVCNCLWLLGVVVSFWIVVERYSWELEGRRLINNNYEEVISWKIERKVGNGEWEVVDERKNS